MRADVTGVGGFFEDLPVLFFVLLGTIAVISTSVFVAEERANVRALAEADATAETLLDALLAKLSRGDGRTISIESLRAINASQVGGLCPLGYYWQLSVIVIHPWAESINLHGEGRPKMEFGGPGYAEEVINALYGVDGGALVEVKCVVWRA